MLTKEQLKTATVLFIALASLWYTAGRDTVRFCTTPWVRVWNVYHYYIGSKYFEELGYFHLYEASLLADEESQDYWHKVWKVRNLKTYEIESRKEIRGRFDPSLTFTPRRWEEFQKDLAALQFQMEPSDWRDVFRDRGYNPSPFWNAVGSFLSNRFSAQSVVQLKLLCSLDLFLFLATFAAIAWAFNLRTAAWVLILLSLSPVNERRFVGGFLQYDWFCAFAIGFCLLKKRAPVPAAGFAAYAVLARIFPALLLGAGAVALFWNWNRRRMLPRRYAFFYGSLVLFLGAGILIGSFGSGGAKAWSGFVEKITFHSKEHTYGERRIGLKQIFTRELLSLPSEIPNEERRIQFAGNRGYYLVAASAMILVLLASLRYTLTLDAILLGLVAVFALTVSSRYYWSYLSLLPLLSTATANARSRRIFAIACQALLFVCIFGYDNSLNPDNYIEYSILNLLLLFFLVALIAWPLAMRAVYRCGLPRISRATDY